MFHLRQDRGLEIDLLIEAGNRLIVAEAKSAATFSGHFLDGPRRLTEELAQAQPHLETDPRILYGGSRSMRRSGGLAVPWIQIQQMDW
ncbi:MAG: hypothetical protein AAF481_15240 [Acidobacteriota bacterium]